MTPEQEDALIERATEGWYSCDEMREQIRLAIRAAVAHERERCAKICDERAWAHQHIGDIGPEMNSTACAAAIRRG